MLRHASAMRVIFGMYTIIIIIIIIIINNNNNEKNNAFNRPFIVKMAESFCFK